MSKVRRKYEEVFKREAVRLAESGEKSAREVERELGLYQGAIGHWRKELDEIDKDGGGREFKKEEARYLREIRILKEELAILKKAVAIFSSKPRTSTSL